MLLLRLRFTVASDPHAWPASCSQGEIAAGTVIFYTTSITVDMVKREDLQCSMSVVFQGQCINHYFSDQKVTVYGNKCFFNAVLSHTPYRPLEPLLF